MKAPFTFGEDELHDSFHLAFGRFMIAWADAEKELYRVLLKYSEVSDPVARAIFSGTRASGMISFIKAIAHNTGMSGDRLADLEYVFAQMAAINNARDHLAHNLSDNSYSYRLTVPQKRLVTNLERNARYGNAVLREIDVPTLDAMTYDLHRIVNHLNMHWGKRPEEFSAWTVRDPGEPQEPWLYKSPQPIDVPGTSRSSSQRPQGQQKPSAKKRRSQP